MQEVMQHINKALERAYIRHAIRFPFNPCVFKQVVIVSELQAPAATDMFSRLYVNPDIMFKLNPKGQDVVVLHEILHQYLIHFVRAKFLQPFVPQLWQIATDLEVNSIILSLNSIDTEEKQFVTTMLYTPERFGFPSNLTAEEYYELLLQQMQGGQGGHGGDPIGQDDQTQSGAGGQHDKDEQNEQGDTQSSDEEGDEESDQTQSGEGDNATPKPQWEHGSGVDGIQKEWEIREGNDEQDQQNQSQTARSIDTNAKIAEAISQFREFVQALKECGSIPAGFERLIQQFTKPKANWRQLLKHYIRQYAIDCRKQDWGINPAPESYYYDIVLSDTQFQPRVRDIGIVIDTSGSINENELSLFFGAIAEMMEQMKFAVHIVTCDTQAYNPQYIKTSDELRKYHVYGGGGTDLMPAINYLNDEKRCRLIVVFSDMIWSVPKEKPENIKAYVIFVSTAEKPEIQWGKIVAFDEITHKSSAG